MVKSAVFDKNAFEYDSWFDRHQIEYAQELDAIREFLPASGKGVEIGAGTGRFAQPLGVSLGIEPSEAMRKIASSRGVYSIDGVAESLPIGDESYEYALLVTTVCFLDSPEVAFREVFRILNKDGHIIVGLIDKNSILGRKYDKRKSESKFYKDANFYSVEEVQKELESAGFSGFDCLQVILPEDADENLKPEIKRGYGEGSFVVLRAHKQFGV